MKRVVKVAQRNARKKKVVIRLGWPVYCFIGFQ